MNPQDMPDADTSPPHAHAPRLFSPRILLGSAVALCAGLAIAWIDTRPHWDDTGITVVAIVIAAAATSLVRVPPWLAALLVASPIVIAEIPHGTGVLFAIPIALVAAYAAAFLRRRVV